MPMGQWYPAMWVYDPPWGVFAFFKAGERETGVGFSIEPDLRLDYEQARLLIPVLEEHGLLKPRLDDRIRAEDLKVTHRLLDLMDGLIRREGV